jgi:hypothetical protein
MKLRIEASCTEDNLMEGLCDAVAIMRATDLISMEIKVRYTKTVDPGITQPDHSYVTITRDSYPTEVFEIYGLKKRVKELEKQIVKEGEK